MVVQSNQCVSKEKCFLVIAPGEGHGLFLWGFIFICACSCIFVREQIPLEKRKSEDIATHLVWKVVGLVTILPCREHLPGLAFGDTEGSCSSAHVSSC